MRESIAGAVGLPIAIVAVVLALVPPFVFYVAWVPGVVGLVLGAVGIVRGRSRLAIAATIVAGASFVVTLGWVGIGLLLDTFAECFNC